MLTYNHDVLLRCKNSKASDKIHLELVDAKTIKVTEKRYSPFTGDEVEPVVSTFSIDELKDLLDSISTMLTVALEANKNAA